MAVREAGGVWTSMASDTASSLTDGYIAFLKKVGEELRRAARKNTTAVRGKEAHETKEAHLQNNTLAQEGSQASNAVDKRLLRHEVSPADSIV